MSAALSRVCDVHEGLRALDVGVRRDVWAASLSPDLLRPENVGTDSKGYVWGVHGQELYPSATILQGSERACYWQGQIGIPFWEVNTEATAQEIDLVFSQLDVEDLGSGYSPYVLSDTTVAERSGERSKIPLSPSDQ